MLGTFVPMHWIGMEGMPRRVADYAAQFGNWNLVISISSFLLGLAQLVFIYNMIVSWKWGPQATANPWRAKTIEWQVSSPPPIFNFDQIPRVVGGPYEYGVPGARHAIMGPEEAEVREHEPANGRRRRRRRRHVLIRPMTDAEHAAYPVDDPRSSVDWSEGGTVLAFVNEVAGGRRLLEAIRERVEAGADAVAVVAPQNQPIVGQIVDRDEVRDAALSRVEVTQQVLEAFGIESVGAVMDPDPSLALDDAVRAFEPRRGPALRALRDPLRAHAQGPGRVGEGEDRGPGHPHPGPRRRRRGPLGRRPHAARRHPDRRQPGPDRAAEGARGGEAAPLHDHLPALGRPHPRRRSASGSPARWPSSTAPTSTPPASR